MRPEVSVLLLTRDGMATLPAVLDALDEQDSRFRFETVAVDSGSSDGTVELLERRVTRLVAIPPSEFNHGTTRNLGIEHCRGDYVVLLVQDARPLSADWLSTLVQPLLDDASLAGTFARQVPRADASSLTRHYLSGWVAAGTTPRTSRVASPGDFLSRAPMERFLSSVFDNVCSCVRRRVWQDIRFPRTPLAEDLEWGRDVLLAGHGLAFVPAAVVEHSHDRPASYELRRTYLVHQRLRLLFGLATIDTFPRLLRAIASTVPLHVSCAWHDGGSTFGRGLLRALALAVAFPLGQYLGVRSADSQRELLRSRGV